mgnify:CR=1 FL=1
MLALGLAGCPPAVVRNPEGSQKRYLLAADYFNRGAIPAAQAELKQAMELDDRYVEAYYLSGLILLREVAELYTNDVQYELKTLSSQIEPILVVILGVLVLILALGVFLPVWDLGRTAFKK